MTSVPISEILYCPLTETDSFEKTAVYFNMITNQNESMCQDPPMASHSLSKSKGRQINITLLILGTEGLREALVNFDVSPKKNLCENTQIVNNPRTRRGINL